MDGKIRMEMSGAQLVKVGARMEARIGMFKRQEVAGEMNAPLSQTIRHFNFRPRHRRMLICLGGYYCCHSYLYRLVLERSWNNEKRSNYR